MNHSAASQTRRALKGQKTTIAKWATVVSKCSGPDMKWDLSDDGKLLLRDYRQVKCMRPECAHRLQSAYAQNLARHHDMHVKDDATKSANSRQQQLLFKSAGSGMSGLAPTLDDDAEPAQCSVRQERTGKVDMQHDAKSLAVAYMHSMGLTVEQCAGMFDPTLRGLMVLANGTISARSILREDDGEGGAGAIPATVADMKKYIRSLVANRKGTICVDGSTTYFAGGRKVLHILFDSVELPSPILLRAVVAVGDGDNEKAEELPPGVAKTGAEWQAQLIRDCLLEYNMKLSDILGLATDNEETNHKLAKLLGLPLFPCIAHMIDLMFEEAWLQFGVGKFFGLRAFMSASPARRIAAEAAGINVAVFEVKESKFFYAGKFVEYMSDRANFDRVLAFVKTQTRAKTAPPAASAIAGNDAGADAAAAEIAEAAKKAADAVAEKTKCELIVKEMQHPTAFIRLQLLKEVVHTGGFLSTMAQSDVRRLHFSLLDDLEGWLDQLTALGAGGVTSVDRIATNSNTKVPASSLAGLGVLLKSTTDAMWAKLKKHLYEITGEVNTSKARDATSMYVNRYDILRRYRVRQYWDICNVERGGMCTPDNLKDGLGREPTVDEVRAYIKVRRLIDENKLGVPVPQRSAVPDAGTVPDDERKAAELKAKGDDVEKAIAFWRACWRPSMDSDVRTVARMALNALGVLMSNSIAERSFSTLSNRQQQSSRVCCMRRCPTWKTCSFSLATDCI